MIYDKIENWKKYDSGNGIFKAFDFILTATKNLTPGKYEIDGDKIFAFVSEYETKPIENTVIETHIKYADIQTVLIGTERQECYGKHMLTVKDEYDIQKDCEFYLRPEEPQCSIKLIPGFFAMYMPDDAHSPQIRWGKTSEKVFKIVVKVDMSILE